MRLFIGLSMAVGFLTAGLCDPEPGKPIEKTESCYDLNKSPYLGFGPFTSYDFVRHKEGITKPKDCSVSQLWMVCSTGTSYPKLEEYKDLSSLDQLKEEVLANHRTHKRGSLCQMDLDNLYMTKFDLLKNGADQLTLSGRQELFELGKRISDAFPEIFYTGDAKSKSMFLHAPSDRSKESANYFYKGLLGLNFYSEDLPTFEDNRDLIYNYPNCTAWEKHRNEMKNLRRKFTEGEEIKKVQKSVTKRLGFEKPLTIGQIMAIYNACSLAAARDNWRTSPWCAAFDEDELKFLEYTVDVYYYHRSGPGYDMNKKLSCPAVKDLMDKFSKRAADATNPQRMASFYFTHKTTTDILNVGLQMTRDKTALTYDDYAVQKQRQYTTAKTMPFAGNLLAVLYQCPSNTKKMIFYQNEHVVEYPECGKSGECDFDTIKEKFNSFVNNPDCTDQSWCTAKVGPTKLET